MKNLNIGVFFDAPNVTHPDYFAMMVFQRIVGDYRADRFTGAHLNTSTLDKFYLYQLLFRR